jgi:hypothetical protein
LSAVEDTPATTTAKLAEGVETRLAEAVVELEALRREAAELAALACSSPASDNRGGIQVLTVRQTAALLGFGWSVHQMVPDSRLGSSLIGTGGNTPRWGYNSSRPVLVYVTMGFSDDRIFLKGAYRRASADVTTGPKNRQSGTVGKRFR